MGRAGQPRPSRVKRIVVIVLLVVILAPIVGYFAVPAVRSRIDGLLNDASVAFALWRNPSGNAVDSNVATMWLANPVSGVPSVTVNFTETTNLAGLIFQIGATPGAEYAAHARPRQVELVFPGETQTVTLDLADDPGPQERCLDQRHAVRTFEIRILGVYEPDRPGQDLIALREVEFIAGNC